jgi:hypothetical protein
LRLNPGFQRMGYDFHITRAGNWCDSKTSPISLEDWTAYVTSDSEMRLDNFAEVETDGEVIRIESEVSCFSRNGTNGLLE